MECWILRVYWEQNDCPSSLVPLQLVAEMFRNFCYYKCKLRKENVYKCLTEKKSVFANYNALNAFEEMNQCHFCLPLSTAFLVSVAILPCLVEPKYINTIIRGAVGGAVSSVLLSNKQRPGGITCHDSYMTGSCYHTPSAEVWKPWSFCCDHLFFKLLLTIWLSVKFIYLKMLITVICNHFIFRFSNVQQSPAGGLRIY